MAKLGELVGFRSDLFFDGAVQIGWFETNRLRREQASTGFVFHGPEYHGVSEADLRDTGGYPLVDTARLTEEVSLALEGKGGHDLPISIAIAGYGTGKSHLGLTLATLFSAPKSPTAEAILSHINQADATIGGRVHKRFASLRRPYLVLALNGMGNFDLAAELTRQVFNQLREHGIDTTAIEELSPRFGMAEGFAQRNFDLRRNEFEKRFKSGITVEQIAELLRSRDEDAYKRVDDVFLSVNGSPINAIGREAPQELIQTICESYCGKTGPFEGLFIIFDEFGRYLEFAADKPHIAGDAALQQVFEGVQNNAEQCFLLCLVQYDLKVYLQRISRAGQSSVQRYVTRYDAAKKVHLSSNLETLIAYLIDKRKSKTIEKLLASAAVDQEIYKAHALINRWFPKAGQVTAWREPQRFRQVIAEGCWPLSPFATWCLSGLGDMLQQRSAITFVKEALEREAKQEVSAGGSPWKISATQLCLGGIIEELVAGEEYGNRGTVAQAYKAVEARHHGDLSVAERHTLLAILIASKIDLRASDEKDARQALAMLSGLPLSEIDAAVKELTDEYGVIEWNERFARFEIRGDSVPRSQFVQFLKKKTREISAEQVETIFADSMKSWARLEDIDPGFAAEKGITTTEWRFATVCSDRVRIRTQIDNALKDWKDAIKTDAPRGQLIYCYVPPDVRILDFSERVRRELEQALAANRCTPPIPLFIVLMHDAEGRLQRAISEYHVLSGHLTDEERQRFAHFIENHLSQLQEEIKSLSDELVKERRYVFTEGPDVDSLSLPIMAYALFDHTYPKILPFPFDGFRAVKGNAAKDCREIVAALFTGNFDRDWVTSKSPQVHNRVRTVLVEGKNAWQILDESGEVSRTPKNKRVADVVLEIESRFKVQEKLNLGAELDRLVAPPYGLNIASVALLLGCFVAPRLDRIAFSLNDQEMLPANWVGKAFAGNFLDPKVLKETNLRYMSDSETGEWQDLLSAWDAVSTHEERVVFMDEADGLQERIPLPAGALYERWKRLQERAEQSRQILESFDRLLSEQEDSLDIAYERGKMDKISHIGKILTDHLKKMKQAPECWTVEQLNKVTVLIDRARSAVVEYFDSWLPYQICRTAEQLSDFRFRMIQQIGGNLKVLDLPKLESKLEAHINQVTSKIQDLQKLRYIVEESKAFLSTHQVTPRCCVAELNDWSKRCDALSDTLQKILAQSGHAPDIEELLKKVRSFKQLCQQQNKKHEERFEAIRECQFCDIEEVRAARPEVQDLLRVYKGGRAADLEDLELLNRQVTEFEKDLIVWNDLSVPTDTLHSLIEARVRECEECADEYEGGWPADEIYRKLGETLIANRRVAANEWLNRLNTTSANIIEMSGKDCHGLLQRLELAPAYLEAEHLERVAALRDAAKRRLDQLRVVEESRAFLSTHRVTPRCCVAELSDWSNRCDALNDILKEVQAHNGHAPDIEELIKKVEAFQDRSQQQMKKHEERFEALRECQFCDIEEVRAARPEVQDLLRVYKGGRAADLEDLELLNRQITEFEKDLIVWNDLSVPTDTLHSLIEARVRECEECADEYEGGWPADEIYRKLGETLIANRRVAANEWLNRLNTTSANIIEMSGKDCHGLLQRLELAPAYLEAEHLERVAALRDAAKKRLDQLQVEGVLAGFRSLPFELKRQFLEVATAEFGQQ